MTVKFVYLDLPDLISLYPPELSHLLDHYINLFGNFFAKIRSNHICFDQKRLKHSPNINKIIFCHKIVKTKLYANNEVYNNEKFAV